MLNQKEIHHMVKDAGLDWHKGYGVGDGAINVFAELVKAAYAAGAKDMRERCAATADSGQYFIRQQASRIAGVSVYIPDIGAAIRALGTT